MASFEILGAHRYSIGGWYLEQNKKKDLNSILTLSSPPTSNTIVTGMIIVHEIILKYEILVVWDD